MIDESRRGCFLQTMQLPFQSTGLPVPSRNLVKMAMKTLCIISFLFLMGCAAKRPPVAPPPSPPQEGPIRSQLPPPSAERIEHCVVVKQENANTVSCSCLPVTTKIDSKTGHMTIVCKKMKEEK
jgi:hypothetical protein